MNLTIKNKSITIGELAATLAQYNPDAEVLISIGASSYPIDCVITGGDKLYLEASEIETAATIGAKGGRVKKYQTEAERRAARVKSQREYRDRKKKT